MMFVKIFLKEWRENILIFTLALLMMAAMVALNLSGQREMTLHFSGMFLLLFLPFAALLIGSGGFYSEYKDNAWIYLFSRPIRKELMWIFKYASQLTILIVVFIIFYFVRRFLPSLDRILQDLDFPNIYIRFFPVSVYVVMPLMAFTIGFSLSLLYDKQFIIFFASILVGLGLLMASQNYVEFLWIKGYRIRNHEIFYFFFALSFILASILTLIKSDFSQPGKKLFRFSIYLLVFLVISTLISTVWITRGEIILPGRDLSVWNTQKYLGSLYLQDFRQGVLRYDPEREKIEKLNKDSRFSFESFSLRAGKIALLQISSGRQWYHDLWIMNDDGTNARPMVESSVEDSPFYKKRIESFIISSDARKVAFTTDILHSEGKGKKNIWIHTLWWMNTDGTGIKSLMLDVPHGKEAKLIAWPRSEESLFLMIGARIISRERAQIFKVDLRNGSTRLLVENVIAPYILRPSPDHDYLTLKIRNYEENKDTLALLNLKTSETIELFSAEFLKMWAGKWSPGGRKIAFSKDRELWIYYVEEDRLEKISQRNYEYEIGFDWTSDGKKFILLAPVEGENHLVVMDESFEEIKRIKIPVRFEGSISVWGLEDQALLKGTGIGALWRVDLQTEDWKKVH